MKKSLVTILLMVAPSLLIYLLCEGIYSVVRWDAPHHSLITEFLAPRQSEESDSQNRWYRPILSDSAEVERLIPIMKEQGVGIGNAPYEELETDAASVNRSVGECLELKPNLKKTSHLLRTPLFERYNPLVVFHDSDTRLDPTLETFIETYASSSTVVTTNQRGERRTVPPVSAQDLVLVAGDSVAFGALLNDDETLASVLQRQDTGRRYINLGIGGADAWEIRCALERSAEQLQGRLRELIYIYCENDFDEDERMGTPEKVMESLRRYVAEQSIERTVIVYAPYIYNVLPELTRLPGERGEEFSDHAQEKARLIALVEEAKYEWLDFGELAIAEAEKQGTRFAALSLYIDVVHHSQLGVERLAEAIEGRRRAQDGIRSNQSVP